MLRPVPMADSSAPRTFRHRLRRFLKVLGVLLALACLGLWLGRNAIANAILDKALTGVEKRAKRAGVEVLDIQSDPVRIPTPLRATLAKVRADFDIGARNRNQVRSRFEAEKIEVTVAGVFPPLARVRLENFSIRFHPDDLPPNFPFEVFHEGSLSSSPLPATDPSAAMKQVFGRFHDLFENNRVEADFEFSGVVSVKVGPRTAKARLYTEPLPDGFRRLRFDEADLRALADASGLTVSDEMLHIASLYPLRAPLMFAITWTAKQDSVVRKRADPRFPEDAYRHVLWSFHLAKTFGPEFAKLVTDSHETLPGNTPEERLMDYHNNAVARGLAAKGTNPANLLRIVLKDPRVIRTPKEVPGRAGLLR